MLVGSAAAWRAGRDRGRVRLAAAAAGARRPLTPNSTGRARQPVGQRRRRRGAPAPSRTALTVVADRTRRPRGGAVERRSPARPAKPPHRRQRRPRDHRRSRATPPTVRRTSIAALRESADSAAQLAAKLSGYRAGLLGSIAASCTARLHGGAGLNRSRRDDVPAAEPTSEAARSAGGQRAVRRDRQPNTRRSTATASSPRTPRPTSTTWSSESMAEHRARREAAIAMLASA